MLKNRSFSIEILAPFLYFFELNKKTVKISNDAENFQINLPQNSPVDEFKFRNFSVTKKKQNS